MTTLESQIAAAAGIVQTRQALHSIADPQIRRGLLLSVAGSLLMSFSDEEWKKMSAPVQECGKPGCDCHKIFNTAIASLGAMRDCQKLFEQRAGLAPTMAIVRDLREKMDKEGPRHDS